MPDSWKLGRCGRQNCLCHVKTLLPIKDKEFLPFCSSNINTIREGLGFKASQSTETIYSISALALVPKLKERKEFPVNIG
jgi:hypothetical protein